MERTYDKLDRSRPPQTAELPAFRLPPVVETRLANGLEVLLVEDRRFPLVTVRLGFPAGSKFDPEGLAGLSESAGALLTEGTGSRSARQIAEEAASIGGAIHANSSADSLVIEANTLAENLPVLLGLVGDVARNATFPDDEVELRKQNRAQELLAQRSQAGFLAAEKFREVVFGPHPYARQEPTLESIGRISRAALADFRERHLAPKGAVLVLVGALPPRAELLDLLDADFGSWTPRDMPPAPAADFPPPKRRVALVDRPESVQADIRIGRLAVGRAHPDYFPLLLGNTILGGGASSRLFMNIRERLGYAYDAHSTLQPLKDAGVFGVTTQVRNGVLVPAMEAILFELENIGAQETSPAELSDAKNYLSGVFVIRLETGDGLAGQVAAVRLMGLPLDYLETYTSRLRAAGPDEVRSAAARYIYPADAAIVVVGDAAEIGARLEKFGEVTVEEAK
jgi:zinc protease